MSTTTESIDVAVAANDDYIQHLGAMLCSLFVNNPFRTFRVYLLGNAVSRESVASINSIASKFQNTVYYIQVDSNAVANFKINSHVSVETYFRLLLPVALPKHICVVLYLDVDVIVPGNIDSLWHTNIDDYHLAAVEDVTASRKNILGISDECQYFNAGVMLVNLTRWRNTCIAEKCLHFINKFPEKIEYWDQDALNAMLYNKWLPLHPKYNMQGPLFMKGFTSYYGDPDELQEAIKQPTIIHYSAPQKPWHYLSYHPYTQEYYKYLALTPWKDFQPNDRTPIRVVRKAVRPYLKKLGVTKVFGKYLY